MANKKYTDLAAAGALNATDILAIARAGASLQTPLSAITTLVLAGFTPSMAAAPVVTDATTARTALPAHASQYVRFTATSAKTWTFDTAQSYPVNSEYHARNHGAGNVTLTPANGFVFNTPYLGTLVVAPGGTVTVKIVAAGVADVFGAVVPA